MELSSYVDMEEQQFAMFADKIATVEGMYMQGMMHTDIVVSYK